MKKLVLYLILLISCDYCFAQEDALSKARELATQKNYEKAADAYADAYNQNASQEVYIEFLNLLLEAKDFKKAEKLIGAQMQQRRNHPLPIIDYGRLLKATG